MTKRAPLTPRGDGGWECSRQQRLLLGVENLDLEKSPGRGFNGRWCGRAVRAAGARARE